MDTTTRIFKIINLVFFIGFIYMLLNLAFVTFFVSSIVGVALLFLVIIIGFVLTAVQIGRQSRSGEEMSGLDKVLSVFPVLNFAILIWILFNMIM